MSTAHLWTKGIGLTAAQKESVEARRNKRSPIGNSERESIKIRLRPHQFVKKYTDEELLDEIRDFYQRTGRIPLKNEFNAWDIYQARFGSWNNAIKKAGFETNPVLFARKFTAADGHVCDSFSEKIIDDLLSREGIAHERHTRYGKTRFTADFKIGSDTLIEFFGLAGAKRAYDLNIRKKRELAEKLGFKLIEIYPGDLYPESVLEGLLGSLRP